MDVAYDAFAESVRLIQSEHLEPVFRLSRRRRFAPMAVDVADDVAVTLFARRGVGCVLSETWVLAKMGASWHMLGGGSGSADDDLLAPRPARLPDYLGLPWTAGTGLDPGLIVIDGSGGVHDSQGRAERWPWSGRWIRHVGLRTSADVESVSIDDRTVRVPWHGRVILASSRRRSPRVLVNGKQGAVLGEIRPFEPAR